MAELATSRLTWCGEMPAHESCIARLQKTCFGDASSCVAATRIASSLLAVAVVVIVVIVIVVIVVVVVVV